MAQQKAKDYYFEKCEIDSYICVRENFKSVSKNEELYLIWLAYKRNGYHSMVGIKTNNSVCFEVEHNFKTGEVICKQLKIVEMIIKPSTDSGVDISTRNFSFL